MTLTITMNTKITMENKQRKKSSRNFYLGIIAGFIIYAIIKELIWPMLSGS